MDEFSKSLRKIFTEAVEIKDPAERAGYLAKACGPNSALRARVDNLLQAHEVAGGFLHSPADSNRPVNQAPGESKSSEAASERIGRYKLLQKLGEGGCGVVYMAEQQEPVRRRLALKIIKLGMDTRSVIARFEAERQALALMDHPNIARVLDAGATETGRPFFVMELVRGIKITDYCDQNNLSTAERLKLFAQVCQAVQHAHQKGIIHRDIKPSNILVTLHDGVPVPKIIDFGIAKATADQPLTDKTLFTRFEMFIGTPAYMSPEQAETSGLDIDTRTDIYSLGVLLYELLTGRPPFDTETLLKSGLDAMRRTIREAEPTRPSTRLRTLAAADLTEIAQRRQSEPPRLISLVRGDLDWIVLKALEKDRTRRYETANALARDLERHLKNEPVTARPPSRIYAFQKLVRRNRVLFAAAAAVALALIVGLGTSTVLFLQERQARQEADNARADEAKQREQANAKTEESRQRLVRLNVVTGNKLVEEGDSHGALLWFLEALRLDEGRPDREEVHRRRFAAVLRSAPGLAQFLTPGGFVNGAEFSPDGTRVVTACYEGTACVWDAHTGEPVTPPLQHESILDSARFTPDGRRVLTVTRDSKLRFWDTATGAALGKSLALTSGRSGAVDFTQDGQWMVAAVPGGAQIFDAATGEPSGPLLVHGNVLSMVCFGPDGQLIATIGASTRVRFWDANTRQRAPNELAHPSRLVNMQFSPDGRRLATLTTDSRAQVWDVTTGEAVTPPMRHSASVYTLKFSPDGRWLATAEWLNVAQVWDANTGLPANSPLRHRGGVAQAKFNPDGTTIATASWDNTARLWDPQTSKPVSPILRHGGFVLTANFSPDGTRLLTAGQDTTVRLWQLRTNSPARLTLRHGAGVARARFSPDGRMILTASYDRSAQVWDRNTGPKLLSLRHAAAVTECDFSSDGRRIVTACTDGTVHVWDVKRGEELVPVIRHAKPLRHVAFSPDNQRLVTASDDGTARVWNATNGEPTTPPLLHSSNVVHAAFSPDGRRVITASRDYTAQLWNAQTGERLGQPLQHKGALSHATFSPDGTRVLTACSDEDMFPAVAQVWDAATGKAVGPPLQHRDGVIIAVFSPNGSLIATGGEDNSAAIWNAATGARVTPPLLHQSIVWHIAFSPDSRFLLSVSSDSTARVWDTSNGEPITPPLEHSFVVRFGAWNPDGREVVTASDDGTARVWDVSPSTAPFEELKRQAELLSAHRLEANIGTVPLNAVEMKERWQALRGRR